MTRNTPMPPRPARKERQYPVAEFSKILEVIEKSCGNVFIAERHGRGNSKVIILPEAMKELDVMLSYGRKAPGNILEQKYLGYGHIVKDGNGNVIIIVKHFIEIHTMNRSAVSAENLGPNGEQNPGLDFLEYYRDEFLRNEAKYNTDAYGFPVDPFMDKLGPSEFVLEGHTHPDIGVFFSHTDKVSGSARAASTPISIFVCDPIRKEMLAAVGSQFAKAEVIVYSRSSERTKSVSEPYPVQTDADGVITIASQCLRVPGYSGSIRYRTRLDGKLCLKIRILVPDDGKDGEMSDGS